MPNNDMPVEMMGPIQIDESSPLSRISSSYSRDVDPERLREGIFHQSRLRSIADEHRGIENIKTDPSISPNERLSVVRKLIDLTRAAWPGDAKQLQPELIRKTDR